MAEMELAPKIFDVKAKSSLVYQAAVAQMANMRQVLAHTKDRGEVRGGGRKPWRQKGTGRARHGSSRSPIWIGGGVTFGPRKDRNFKQRINQKMKQKAIFMVLSDKVANENLLILDKLEVTDYKTKVFNQILSNLEKVIFPPKPACPVGRADQPLAEKQIRQLADKVTKRSILVINDKNDEKIKYSARNLVGVELINLDNINIVDLLKYKHLILTKAAIEKLQAKYL